MVMPRKLLFQRSHMLTLSQSYVLPIFHKIRSHPLSTRDTMPVPSIDMTTDPRNYRPFFDSHQSQYESLCAGRTLNETLWRHECFCFFKDIVRVNAGDCMSVPWDRTDLAIASQLDFDGNQIPTLQEAVEMSLGPRKTGQGEDIYMAEPPCCVRIRYTPATLERCPFRHSNPSKSQWAWLRRVHS